LHAAKSRFSCSTVTIHAVPGEDLTVLILGSLRSTFQSRALPSIRRSVQITSNRRPLHKHSLDLVLRVQQAHPPCTSLLWFKNEGHSAFSILRVLSPLRYTATVLPRTDDATGAVRVRS